MSEKWAEPQNSVQLTSYNGQKKDNYNLDMGVNNKMTENDGYENKVGVVETVPPKDKKDGEAKEKKEKQPTVSIKSLYRYADNIDAALIMFGILLSCSHGVALPAMIIVFGEMTDSFVDQARFTNASINCSVTPADPACTFDLIGEMSKFAIYYTIIGCGVLVAATGQVTLMMVTAYRQTYKIRLALFKSILRQDIGWFDTHEIGELNTRMSDDVNKIQDGIGDKVSNFFQWFSAFVCGIIIGFIYGWKLTLVILAVSPLLVASGGFMTSMLTSFTTKELAAYAKAGAVAEEVLGAIRTVVAFGGQAKEVVRYTNNLDDAKKFGMRKGLIGSIGMGVVFFVIFAVYALAFWYGCKLVRDEPNNYSVGNLLIVFFGVMIGAFSLGHAAPNLQNIATARGAAYVVWGVIDRNPPIDSSSPDGLKPASMEGFIEFKNVSFRYPSRPDTQILRGLSLTVKRGQSAALVGSSGCGKSTTVQLLQRFYDPLDGQVCVDGRDVTTLNIRWLRDHIGVVSQEPVLFATTIEENIRYGRDGVTLQEIEEAAKMANAYNFIQNLPQKFKTLVGERGAQLSGGQKQRIAIARALVRDPKILLLDEATSALDTESEATVQAALDRAREGRTTIVIAHRLSTIRNADIIYGVRDGVVIEQGTHDELMSKQGLYYDLVNKQNLAAMEDAVEQETGPSDVKLATKEARELTRVDSLVKQTSVGDELQAQVKKDEEEVSMFRVVKMNSPEWPFIAIGCFAAMCNGVVQPGFALIFSEVLGVFAEKDLEKQERNALLYSMMFLVIGIGAGLAMFFQGFMFSISGEKLTMRIRHLYFRALLRQDQAYFDDPANTVGALTTRLATDASAVQGASGSRFGTIIQSLSCLGAGFVIGFIYSWKLTLMIIGFVPFILAAGMLQMKIMGGSAKQSQSSLEGAGKVAIEAIENIRTVAALCKEEKFYQDYIHMNEAPYKASLKRAVVYGFAFSFSQAIMFYANAATFYFGAWLIIHDGLAYANMFKVFSAIVFGAMSVGQASQFAPDYSKAKIAAGRMFGLFDRVPPIDSYSEDGDKPEGIRGTVEFEAVHFNYPTRMSVKVLKGLSLRVEPGQTVALVGSSGCGKSTSVQLLERLYNVLGGGVLIDGNDLRNYNIQWLRRQMGLVSQEPILFDTSIADNIAYGDNFRKVEMEEIIKAARLANIHNFIETLPEGYNTRVGDKGTQLSGGQKQRVAIARALLRNPKILLLDEATSALDTESERIVQEALDRAREGRTCIVIAHRLSTIQNADCIFVINNGRVAERGTHQELLALKGLYHKLSARQTLTN